MTSQGQFLGYLALVVLCPGLGGTGASGETGDFGGIRCYITAIPGGLPQHFLALHNPNGRTSGRHPSPTRT